MFKPPRKNAAKWVRRLEGRDYTCTTDGVWELPPTPEGFAGWSAEAYEDYVSWIYAEAVRLQMIPNAGTPQTVYAVPLLNSRIPYRWRRTCWKVGVTARDAQIRVRDVVGRLPWDYDPDAVLHHTPGHPQATIIEQAVRTLGDPIDPDLAGRFNGWTDCRLLTKKNEAELRTLLDAQDPQQ